MSRCPENRSADGAAGGQHGPGDDHVAAYFANDLYRAGCKGILLMRYNVLQRDGHESCQGNKDVNAGYRKDGRVDGTGDVLFGMLHLVDGIDHKLKTLVGHEGDRGHDEYIEGRRLSGIGCHFTKKFRKSLPAVRDEYIANDDQYGYFRIYHQVFNLAHALYAPYVDACKNGYYANGHQLSNPFIIGEGKAADRIGRESIGIEGQGADISEDGEPSDDRSGQVRLGVAALKHGVGGSFIFVVKSELYIGVSGQKSDKSANADGHRSQIADHGNRNAENREYPSTDHSAQGNGHELEQAETFSPSAKDFFFGFGSLFVKTKEFHPLQRK